MVERRDRVARLVESKRETHPELRGPVEFDDLLTVCAREGVIVRRGPLPRAGVAISLGGVRVIGLDSQSPRRRDTYVLAHELAHIWMHSEDEPVVVHMEEPWPEDPREDEAEYCALLLLQGWHHQD